MINLVFSTAAKHRLEVSMHDIVDPSATAGARKDRPLEQRIGFVGLGRMGAAMATNLVRAGCQVIGYVHRPDRMKQLGGSGPMGDPGDFGKIVAFLCSEQAKFISGVALNVDGAAVSGLL